MKGHTSNHKTTGYKIPWGFGVIARNNGDQALSTAEFASRGTQRLDRRGNKNILMVGLGKSRKVNGTLSRG